MSAYEVGGVNVLVGGANLLYLNKEECNLMPLKIHSFAHYTLQGQILTF